jgi:hypothetical protein
VNWHGPSVRAGCHEQQTVFQAQQSGTQILRWHHMLTSAGYRPDSVQNSASARSMASKA